MVNPQTSGDAQQPPRRTGVSSQAGLASLAGPRHSYASVPAPGQPGSRFNPVVREREPEVLEESPSVASALITTLGQTLEATTAPAQAAGPEAIASSARPPISERYDYKFEEPERLEPVGADMDR